MVKEKRIESKTSRNAEFTCMIRASSFDENTNQYKSDDYIAPILIPNSFYLLLK